MDDDPSRTWTVSQIRRFMHRSRAATYMALSRFVGSGRIARIDVGLYRSVRSLVSPGLPDPDLRLHGLKLEVCYDEVGGPYLRLFQILTSVWASPGMHRHPTNRSVTTTGEWRGRVLTITLHKRAQLLEVFLQASTLPLNLVLDVNAYLASLETVFGIPLPFWTVRQADWNVDLVGVRSNASLSLGVGLPASQLGAVVVKVYQKAVDLARIEVRSFAALDADVVTDYIRSIWGTLRDVYQAEAP